jgi:predicted Rossmann fold flavoprotein
MKSKIAIIGAGASGIISAIQASKKNSNQIDIYEKNSAIAKKILASGNGKCNITNQNISIDDYYCSKPSFLKYTLHEFDFNKCKKMFETLGILLYTKEDGKTYPLSNEAKSVVTILSNHLNKENIKLHTNTIIEKITKNKNRFEITTENQTKSYDKVILATGSNSYKNLGGTDIGNHIAKSFGHNIIPNYPALVQLNLKDNLHQLANGVKIKATVTLLIDNTQKEQIHDDILFTQYGISGLAILDLSVKISKALQNKRKIKLSLNLLPQFSFQEIVNMISKLCKLNSNFSILHTLCGFIHSKLALMILKSLNINKLEPTNKINQKIIKNIANKIVNFTLEVNDTKGFDYAEVSGGGVDITQINDKTFESKLVKNMYICGELLDVIGKRGGYNLHFAWGSGYIAGNSI